MKEVTEILKDLPPTVVETAYSDSVSETLKEASKIGVDAVKTVRLALFPLQFAAAMQDRLARYIDGAVRKVPEAHRIPPMESITLQIADKLRFQEETNSITALYVNLLARAMDKERVGEAHPAFLNLISQLAPDEVLLIEQLAKGDYLLYMRDKSRRQAVLNEERELLIERASLPPEIKSKITLISVRPECLAQPEMVYTFIEHLASLGIVVYKNDVSDDEEFAYKEMRRTFGSVKFWFVQLNEFGRLFHSACVAG
jgi:hypothetical protein